MCKFCDMKLDEYDRSEEGCNYAPMVYIEIKEGNHILVASGDDVTEFKINYCPICGREF